MSKFFVCPENVTSDVIIIDNKDDVKHMTGVLRMKVGDEITVSDQDLWEYKAEILAMEKDSVTAKITDRQKLSSEPEIRVTLFQGVPKSGKVDDVTRKCTEMGIDTIVPVFMKRSVVKDTGSYRKKVQRFRTIAAEASKQCKRSVIPTVKDAMTFKEMLPALKAFDKVILPYEEESGRTMKDALRSLEEKPKNLAVIIGPEGGFAEEEAKAIVEAGGIAVTLGKTILRTETAGPAALAMIMYELEL